MALDEETLAERVRQGDEDALAKLFSLYRPRFWRLVNFRLDARLTGRIDADDILQDSYLAALQRLQHLSSEPSASVFVWLRLIVHQTLVDVHRRHLGARMRDAGREANKATPAFGNSASLSLVGQLIGKLTSPSQAAVRNEVSQKLEEAIDQMDGIDRDVLALRHFEELTNSETAEVLGIQPKAASIRYIRAIKRLKDILSQIPGFQQEGTAS